MEGPTPVSALIHAATMVTAGVYLIIKCSNIIENSYTSLNIIACFGAVTAFFAASSGLFLSDIKKIIAYSTCSQLGYMIFACGISAYNVSLFHLMNHAVFKALLFLGAGAIIHSVSNEQDIRRMGNLIKILPMTYCTFLIATLAIIGFPFLTGFFSKDMIIENTFGFYSTKSLIMHFFAVLTALFTAIYSFKILYFVFFIKTNLLKSYTKNLHESEMAMGLPLILLAIGSVFIGFIFKDIIIGTGSNFFQTGVSIKLTKHIETEFITILSKLFPFIATGLGGLILILYLILYKKNNIFYTVFVYKKLFFFTNK
jgi:NADH-ubiquinone oxidoreductase chain 5